MPKSLARLIREARVRAGLSQHALAREVGLAPSHLARLETGAKSLPRFDTIARLAVVLGLSLDAIAREVGYDIEAKKLPLDRADARRLETQLGELRRSLKATDVGIAVALEHLSTPASQKGRKRRPG